MTSITLELDEKLQAKLENYASKHGQSLSDSVCYLLSKSCETADYEDFDLDGTYTEEEERSFYSTNNITAIMEAVKRADEGNVIAMSYQEWVQWSNELKEQFK